MLAHGGLTVRIFKFFRFLIHDVVVVVVLFLTKKLFSNTDKNILLAKQLTDNKVSKLKLPTTLTNTTNFLSATHFSVCEKITKTTSIGHRLNICL